MQVPTNALGCASLTKGTNNKHLSGIVDAGQMTLQQVSDYARSLSQCCGKRGHLASITSPKENALIQGLITPSLMPDPFGTPAPDYVHIGLNNHADLLQYVWHGTTETVANSGVREVLHKVRPKSNSRRGRAVMRGHE
jgi:hypothetical protein